MPYWFEPSTPAGSMSVHLVEEAAEALDEDEIEDPTTWDPVRMGFFVFENFGGDEIADPYLRIARPARAIKVDMLPAGLRKMVAKGLRFNFSFEDAYRFQPAEFARCFAWYHYYLCEDDHTIRPIPGKEAEARARFKEEYGRSKKYVLDESPWEPRTTLHETSFVPSINSGAGATKKATKKAAAKKATKKAAAQKATKKTAAKKATKKKATRKTAAKKTTKKKATRKTAAKKTTKKKATRKTAAKKTTKKKATRKTTRR
jgi:hypothetical protein